MGGFALNKDSVCCLKESMSTSTATTSWDAHIFGVFTGLLDDAKLRVVARRIFSRAIANPVILVAVGGVVGVVYFIVVLVERLNQHVLQRQARYRIVQARHAHVGTGGAGQQVGESFIACPRAAERVQLARGCHDSCNVRGSDCGHCCPQRMAMKLNNTVAPTCRKSFLDCCYGKVSHRLVGNKETVREFHIRIGGERAADLLDSCGIF
mmetsp:Transcript_37082/g.72844  ORF Transcript_37082/g.72844 Transcript_37082/m.72844 type:complete len:209 (+) Transcript_37082:145-771(+)